VGSTAGIGHFTGLKVGWGGLGCHACRIAGPHTWGDSPAWLKLSDACVLTTTSSAVWKHTSAVSRMSGARRSTGRYAAASCCGESHQLVLERAAGERAACEAAGERAACEAAGERAAGEARAASW
jgi:hypothetical protein